MCYLPPPRRHFGCASALWLAKATFTASNAAHWSWVVRSPSARTHSCSGSLASLLVYWDSRSSANRNNGCSRGRPLRQADHRIQIALKSAPRAMGKTLVSAPSARIRLGRLATAVPNARRATCSASRRTEYDQLSMATGKAIGTAARLQYDLATRVTTSHHDDS
jgi:hypothetical protein